MTSDLQPTHFEIRVRGHLGETLLGAFAPLDAETCGKDTLLRGRVDQAALYGAIAQVEALGLELLEVRHVPN
jgi:hypothetical protein